MTTLSGLVQTATRRATASAWSLHPCLSPGTSQHLESRQSHSCLGHREEGKIFSPDQLETLRRAKVTQRLLPKVTVPLGRSRGSRVLLWPPGSRRGKEGSFLGCQLLPAGALLLASRLFPRSFSTFMVLNLPFFLLSDSASLWKSEAKNKDSARKGGKPLDRMGSGQRH